MSEEQLKGWNHLPDVPLKTSPFFIWPLNPIEMAKWVWNSWFLITEKLIIVGIAFACYVWFQPPLEETRIGPRDVPTHWRLAIPSKGLEIETEPLNPQAWMATSFPYWEGPIRFDGTKAGIGYLEMTGYD